MKVTNSDLLTNRNKYSIDILEKNIAHLDEKILLVTQTLTPEFCVKYILDLNIEGGGPIKPLKENVTFFYNYHVCGFSIKLNDESTEYFIVSNKENR